jgi:hypothetical protein
MAEAHQFEVVFDEGLVEMLFRELGDEIEADLAELALRAAQEAEGPLKRSIISRLNKNPTGAMARSVRSTLVERGGRLVSARAFADVVYARIHEAGGVIRAKGKLLAVPLSFANVPRGMSPKDWPRGELKVIPRKGKDSLLGVVGRAGKTRNPAPKYVLKRQVTIPGVRYAEAAAEQARPAIEQTIREGLRALVARVAAKKGRTLPDARR